MAANEKNPPQGRFRRLARMAEASVRTGTSALMRQTHQQSVKKAAEILGDLRGLAAKTGQMAAYVDGLVPEHQREAYERWMQRLLDAAPSSSPQEVRARIEEELGQTIDALFLSWEDQPFASASIGQVHRATLKSGEKVAVKVQHPGVDNALESDLRNLGLMESMASVTGARQFGSKDALQAVQERLREELDYRLEAKHQMHFAELHQDDSQIVIPKVHTEYSSRHVLTSELMEGGISFQEACAATEEERRQWCETLWRFVFRGTLVGGVFNADPHPGNYIFFPKGRVAFLDFGCVQHLDEDYRNQAIAVHQAALAGREEDFAYHVCAMLGTRGGDYEAWALGYVRRCFEPLFESPYRFTREYAASMVQGIKDIATQSMWKRGSDFVPLPPHMVMMNRLQCGFYSVLARLDCEVDYAAVERCSLGLG